MPLRYQRSCRCACILCLIEASLVSCGIPQNTPTKVVEPFLARFSRSGFPPGISTIIFMRFSSVMPSRRPCLFEMSSAIAPKFLSSCVVATPYVMPGLPTCFNSQSRQVFSTLPAASQDPSPAYQPSEQANKQAKASHTFNSKAIKKAAAILFIDVRLCETKKWRQTQPRMMTKIINV